MIPGSQNRIDLFNLRYLIAFCHLAFGMVCLYRPNLDKLIAQYAPFGNMERWGVGLTFLAIVLLCSSRGSLILMVAQLASSTTLFVIATLLSGTYGAFPTAAALGVLGGYSLLLFLRTFFQWLERQGFWTKWLKRPPSWARRIKARLEAKRNG